MVRSLDAALVAALDATTRRPAISLTVEDHVAHYAPYQTPGTADALNDACIASDNSIIRVQVTRNGFAATFQVQRIIDPTSATQWASWTTLPGATGILFQDGGCAVSNSHGTLRAFAQRGTGGNNIFAWTSTNNGITWTGPVTVLTPTGGALLKGIGSAGNDDVFFIYDISGGEAIGCSFYTTGSWSSLTTWTLATLSSGAGLAVAWNGSLYTLVYSDSYSLTTCTFTPATSSWNSGVPIASATSTAIGRFAPRLSFANGLYTLTSIESDSGLLTGSVYSYPRLRQSVDLVHWSNGMIMHDLPASYGVVLISLPIPASGSAGPRSYLASLSTVYSARLFQSTNPAQSLDISNAVLSYRRVEQSGLPARLELIVDNARGVLNSFVTTSATYQPIGLNASLVLNEGYKVGTSTNDTVAVGIYHIEQIHFVRSPLENHLLLIGRDLSHNLDLIARYQNVYSNQTLGFLITEVCACVGLFSVVLPATSQVSQLVPSFVLQAGSSYRNALDELCTTYGLSYFLNQNEVMQFRELSVSDVSVWSYQPEIESVSFGSDDQRANHIVVSGKPPLAGLPGALTTAEAFDDTHLHMIGVERLLHHVDPKLTTTAQCSQKAAFLMAQEVRSTFTHTVTVPLNPALQLLDCITLTDSIAPAGSGQQSTCRIVHIAINYNAQNGVDEMQLTLEGL